MVEEGILYQEEYYPKRGDSEIFDFDSYVERMGRAKDYDEKRSIFSDLLEVDFGDMDVYCLGFSKVPMPVKSVQELICIANQQGLQDQVYAFLKEHNYESCHYFEEGSDIATLNQQVNERIIGDEPEEEKKWRKELQRLETLNRIAAEINNPNSDISNLVKTIRKERETDTSFNHEVELINQGNGFAEWSMRSSYDKVLKPTRREWDHSSEIILKDIKNRSSYWQKKMAEGDVYATYLCAHLEYEYAYANNRDILGGKAAYIIKECANAGCFEAITDVGKWIQDGVHGFNQNNEKALNYFLEAALSFDPRAINYLGLSYYYGTGVEKNEEYGSSLRKLAEKLGYNYFEDYSHVSTDFALKYTDVFLKKRDQIIIKDESQETSTTKQDDLDNNDENQNNKSQSQEIDANQLGNNVDIPVLALGVSMLAQDISAPDQDLSVLAQELCDYYTGIGEKPISPDYIALNRALLRNITGASGVDAVCIPGNEYHFLEHKSERIYVHSGKLTITDLAVYILNGENSFDRFELNNINEILVLNPVYEDEIPPEKWVKNEYSKKSFALRTIEKKRMIVYGTIFDELEAEQAFEALYKYIKCRYALFSTEFGNQYAEQSDWDILCMKSGERYPMSDISLKGLFTEVMSCPYCKRRLAGYDERHFRKAIYDINIDYPNTSELQAKITAEYENDSIGFLNMYKTIYSKDVAEDRA